MNDQRVEIPGSTLELRGSERWSGPADPDQPMSATLTLRRRSDAAPYNDLEQQLLSGTFRPVSRDEAAQTLGADPNDIAAVRSWAQQHGLTVTNENGAARTMRVEGTALDMNQAFGVHVGWIEDPNGRRYLGYQGALSVPGSLAGIVIAVLGLDQRPIATHHSAL